MAYTAFQSWTKSKVHGNSIKSLVVPQEDIFQLRLRWHILLGLIWHSSWLSP